METKGASDARDNVTEVVQPRPSKLYSDLGSAVRIKRECGAGSGCKISFLWQGVPTFGILTCAHLVADLTKDWRACGEQNATDAMNKAILAHQFGEPNPNASLELRDKFGLVAWNRIVCHPIYDLAFIFVDDSSKPTKKEEQDLYCSLEYVAAHQLVKLWLSGAFLTETLGLYCDGHVIGEIFSGRDQGQVIHEGEKHAMPGNSGVGMTHEGKVVGVLLGAFEEAERDVEVPSRVLSHSQVVAAFAQSMRNQMAGRVRALSRIQPTQRVFEAFFSQNACYFEHAREEEGPKEKHMS